MIEFCHDLALYKQNFAILLMVAILTGCNDKAELVTPDTEMLMDTIERNVDIPSDGRSLDEYVRYYTQNSGGTVSAVYIVIDREGVEAMCDDGANPPCTLEARKVWIAEPGTRMWLQNFELVPGMDDGGCDYIQFEYDPKETKISKLKCNAEY